MSDGDLTYVSYGLGKILVYGIVLVVVLFCSACVWCCKKCCGRDDEPESNAIPLPPPQLTPAEVASSNPYPGVPYPRAAAPPPHPAPSGAPYPPLEPYHPSGASYSPHYSAGTTYPATGSQTSHPSPVNSSGVPHAACTPQPSDKSCPLVGATLPANAILSGINNLTVTEPAPAPPSYEQATSAVPMSATETSRRLAP